MSANGAPRAGRREWIGLAVLALPTMLIGLDGTMLHLAIPQLSADLRPSGTEVLWIADIYSFLVAGFLVTMGTLGDRVGRRRLLLIGAAAFAVASVLAAYSVNTGMLIAMRALLGVAGATLMPSTLSLISNMFRDPDQRRFAIAVWMTNFMLGGMVGPIVGGAMLERFWWGSIFLLGVPVSMILLVAAPVLLPEYRDARAGRLDVASVVLSIGAIIPVVYGLKEIAQYGPQPLPALSVAAGLLVGTAFVRRQLRLADPVLDLRLFSGASFGVALGAQTIALFVIAGTQFLTLQYLQLVAGLSALQAGLWSLPAMLAGMAGTMLAPSMVRPLSPRWVMAAGFVLSIAGLALIAQVDGGSGVAFAVTGFAVVAFTLQVVLVPSYDVIMGSAPPERAGNASGMGETGSELGIAVGVAVAGSAATTVYRGRLTDARLPDGLAADQTRTVRETVGNASAVAEQLPGGLGHDLLTLAQQAFSAGVRTAAVVNIAIVAVLAILTATMLKRTRTQPEAHPSPAPRRPDREAAATRD